MPTTEQQLYGQPGISHAELGSIDNLPFLPTQVNEKE